MTVARVSHMRHSSNLMREEKNIRMNSQMTDEQLAIANHTSGPALVVAGAGTGKTYTICEHVATLVEHGVAPENIMMLTFTNAAADEMCERIAERIGPERAERIVAGTFHSVAVRMLRTYGWTHSRQVDGDEVEQVTTRNFSVLSATDNVDNIRLVRGHFVKSDEDLMPGESLKDARKRRAAHLKLIKFPEAGRLAEIISDYENRGLESIDATLSLSKYKDMKSDALVHEIERFQEAFELHKQNSNMLSFDDLIIAWMDLVMAKPRTCSNIEHLVIDEAQDMNGRQHELMAAITQAMPQRNVMLVGDAAQSIYGWRGSDVHAFDEFAKIYDATVYHLSKNFRSQPEILEIANEVLDGANVSSITKLVAGRKDLDKTRLRVVTKRSYPKDNMDYPRITISELCHKRRYETLAVLGRTAREMRPIEAELNQNDIPYVMRGGVKFSELDCVRDVLTMTQMAYRQNAVSAAEVARVMGRYYQIGENTASRVTETPFPDCLKDHGFTNGRNLRHIAVRNMCRDLTTAKLNVSMAPSWLEGLQEAIDWYLDMTKREQLLTIHNTKSERSDREREQELSRRLKDASEELSTLMMIATKSASYDAFADKIKLESPTIASEDEREPQVTLSTIHSAKGLEWDRVIVLGAVDEVFPGDVDESDPYLRQEEQEEQRRCLYVAVTRAREKLVLVMPDRLIRNGRSMYTTRCRYLK